jgi:hypothetical protein
VSSLSQRSIRGILSNIPRVCESFFDCTKRASASFGWECPMRSGPLVPDMASMYSFPSISLIVAPDADSKTIPCFSPSQERE